MKLYSDIIFMALSGVRPKGVDHNGNDQFIVRLSDEFASKDECISVIGNSIDKFVESLNGTNTATYYESKELLIERLDRVKSSIGRLWEYSTHSNTLDAYVLECFDIIFCLLRSTSWKGWYHSICLGTHAPSWLSFGEKDYDIFYTASIEDKYTVEHKFDQQMFDHKPKYAEKNTNGFIYPCGSRMYVPEERVYEIKPVSKTDMQNIIAKQQARIDEQLNKIVPSSTNTLQTQHGIKLILKTKA